MSGDHAMSRPRRGADREAPVERRTQDPAAPRPATPREVDIKELLKGHRQMTIRHGASLYLLRLTRHNKLILTK